MYDEIFKASKQARRSATSSNVGRVNNRSYLTKVSAPFLFH